MAKTELKEFSADHNGGVVAGGEVPDPVDGAGGPVQPRKADVKKPANPEMFPNPGALTPEEDEAIAAAEANESLAAVFNGLDLSEDLKKKITLVFEAAVNEAASAKAKKIVEETTAGLTERFEAEYNEAVEKAMDEITENLDSYLDYVVEEWMKENEIAIESGIKVNMAESFMSGLKTLFEQHNVQINEETVDVVADLEEQVEALRAKTNAVINENITLSKEIASLQANKIFTEVSEGLSVAQVERLRVLSEKLDHDDLEMYSSDLQTLKESFFSQKPVTAKTLTENTEEGKEILVEDTKPARVSQYDSVNSIVSFLNNKK